MTPPIDSDAAPLAPGAPLANLPAAPIIGSTGIVGKRRGPVAAWLLSGITFGVYYLVWWHHINAEIRRYNPSIRVSPGLATLAQIVPVASLVSIYRTAGRVRAMEAAEGQPNPISPGLTLLLGLVFGLHVVLLQSHLNAHWAIHTS